MRAHIRQENIVDSVVGLRPYRHGAPRMELERMGDKLVAHNYGHGGSGITLCWGAARYVTELLCQSLEDGSEVAVLGSGVMGLCCATLLQRTGHRVSIYAKDFPPNTTSDIAGGLWAPTHVGPELPPGLFKNILDWSWQAFEELEGDDFSVYKVHLYQADDASHPLDPLPEHLTGKPLVTANLPIGKNAPSGRVCQTFLIETGPFLDKLATDIERKGGTFHKREFSALEQIMELPEQAVVTCLGLGAGKLFRDEAVVPIRGQLLILKPLPKRFILDHAGGYLISRGDRLVLGGTFEEGVEDTTPCSETAGRILKGNRDFQWD